MAVVVDHLLIHKCEKGGREGMKDTCLQIDVDEGDRFPAVGAIISA